MNEAEVKKMLGLKIRKLRKHVGLTQFALGEKIGLDQRQIAYIEGGNSFPSLKTLLKFTQIFECSLKELFDYEEFTSAMDLREKIQSRIAKFNEKELNLCKNMVEIINNFCLDANY